MGTNCVPLVADLFLFCYKRDFIMSPSDDKQADIIDAFNTTSRYFCDILNSDHVYFDNMVSQIYPSDLQLNKAKDKRDDFDFEIVNFTFLDGDVSRSTFYGVYISLYFSTHLICYSI